MEQRAIKEILYSSLLGIVNNKNYYYKGTSSSYSHLTENGETVVKEFINIMAWHILETENQELDQRAKDMVIRGLKS